MILKNINIEYEEYENLDELEIKYKDLILKAREALKKSYSPYSNFKVGAAALLNSGKILSSANQENAAYSVCICAERALLSTISSVYENDKIEIMAITYLSENFLNDVPLSPCGMCRQAILEYEERMQKEITLLLTSNKNKIIKIEGIKKLLPLYFNKSMLY